MPTKATKSISTNQNNLIIPLKNYYEHQTRIYFLSLAIGTKTDSYNSYFLIYQFSICINFCLVAASLPTCLAAIGSAK